MVCEHSAPQSILLLSIFCGQIVRVDTESADSKKIKEFGLSAIHALRAIFYIQNSYETPREVFVEEAPDAAWEEKKKDSRIVPNKTLTLKKLP